MAKLKISDYSSTSAGANLNTDINSINIDEGCAPSGINDALRTLMAQLKDFQTGVTGDSLTLGGALSGTSATFSGDLTVDTNTLYVDSTNNRVGIGTSSPNYHMTINGGASATSIQLANTATGTGPANGLLIYQDGVNSRIQNIEAGVLTLWTSNTERMRIDSSGNVGIGASSPSTKLDVTSATSSVAKFTTGAVSSVMYNSTGSGTSYWGDPTVANSFAVNAGSNYVSAWTNNTERMRIDSSGNVGIGTSSPGGKLDIRGASVSYTTVASPSSSIWTGKNFAFRDEASYGTGVGGAIVFEGKYNAAGDLSTYGWIRGSKKNATDGDPYGNIYYGTRYGHHIFVTDANGYTNGTGEKMRITDVGNVGIGTSVGTTTVSSGLAINNATATNYPGLEIQTAGTTRFYLNTNNTSSFITTVGSIPMVFSTNTTERMRIEESQGAVLIGGASLNPAANIVYANPEVAGQGMHLVVSKTVAAAGSCLYLNRQGNDGDLIEFRQANTTEGKITVSGTTVSYNGGHLSRFAQLPNSTKDETILKGTVLSNLDDMCVYVNAETGESVDNEQLNKVKVSDVEGDPNVAGVHVSWIYDEQHDVEEINMAMTGDMIIRIAQGVTVNRGDLLMSAGDGTAKPQGDDIVRSKTIAKVTSTSVTCTYEDGSYCVPCVLMAC